MRHLGRRQFLYSLCGASATAGLSLAPLLCSGQTPESDAESDTHRASGEIQPVTRSAWALGSTVSIKVIHPCRLTSERAIEAAFAELELVETLMSIYRPDSQLSRLNRDQVLEEPHPLLVEVLQSAQRISERSDGAFDISIQPLWELYANMQRTGTLPSDANVQAALSRVGWRRVQVASDRIRLQGKGTKITLNGIAQGFAADRVKHVLRNHGIQHALIDTGEIGTLGAKQRDDGWTIAIQHPRLDGAYLSLAKLAGRCLATSGDYATCFTSDKKHHHLFDPRTGRSPVELSSVSIVAETALDADSLSTAVFVLGADRGLTLIEATAGVDAMLVTKSGQLRVTGGFPLA